MILIENNGQISLSYDETTKEIYFTYKEEAQKISNPVTTAKYPFLVEEEGARPALGNKGWLATASDIKDKRGVILQKYTFANGSAPFTTYRAYGFEPTTGVITGLYNDGGEFKTIEEIKASGDTSSANYVAGMKTFSSVMYQNMNKEDENKILEAINQEVKDWLANFEGVINPDEGTSQNNASTSSGGEGTAQNNFSTSGGATTTEIYFPNKFNKKSADKITNFNPSTDTLEINTYSFGIDSSATFATGKNKKEVRKKLAKQEIDFLYDQKKGGLYFNENGSDKGFGEGGIVAILKGAPDLTSDNLEFI